MSPNVPLTLRWVGSDSPEALRAVRQLFAEYARTLEGSICLQDFGRELAELPGRYAPPEGRLLLGLNDAGAVGCVALRKLAEEVCEMKRLYVRPEFRGGGCGRALVEALIREAQQAGYARMQLDTLPSMREAIALYESLGFRRVPASGGCCGNAAIDMELRLRACAGASEKSFQPAAGCS
jgi:ribosomal protein S18 acetylase RimI-like enzyme